MKALIQIFDGLTYPNHNQLRNLAKKLKKYKRYEMLFDQGIQSSHISRPRNLLFDGFEQSSYK